MIISYIYLLTILGTLIYLYFLELPPQIEIPKTAPQSPAEDEPLISIIVPTRNEENNIGRCLQSLVALEYSNTEIIVVDGNSTDRTTEIVKEFPTVKLVHTPELPQGWVGKSWGCYSGYLESAGEVLLFTDADTWHHPRSLTATAAALQKSDGFLSFQPTQEFRSFWEHLQTILWLIISLTFLAGKGSANAQLANGQYMMFTRETYVALGTHEQVAGEILEDIAFATHATKVGVPPFLVARDGLVITRMYQSLGEISDGFGRNLGLGLSSLGARSTIPATLLLSWGLGPVVLGVIALVSSSVLSAFELGVIIGGYLSFVLLLYLTESRVTTKGTAYVVFYPIYYIVLEIIFIRSLVMTSVRKEITWKDRTYQLDYS